MWRNACSRLVEILTSGAGAADKLQAVLCEGLVGDACPGRFAVNQVDLSDGEAVFGVVCGRGVEEDRAALSSECQLGDEGAGFPGEAFRFEEGPGCVGQGGELFGALCYAGPENFGAASGWKDAEVGGRRLEGFVPAHGFERGGYPGETFGRGLAEKPQGEVDSFGCGEAKGVRGDGAGGPNEVPLHLAGREDGDEDPHGGFTGRPGAGPRRRGWR